MPREVHRAWKGFLVWSCAFNVVMLAHALAACSRDEKAAAPPTTSPPSIAPSQAPAAPAAQPLEETVAFLQWAPSALENPSKAAQKHECYSGSDPDAGWCKGNRIIGDFDHGTQNMYWVDWLKKEPAAVRVDFSPLSPDRAIDCTWLAYSELRHWSYASATKQLCAKGAARILIEQYVRAINSTKVIVFTTRYEEANAAFSKELTEG